MELDLQSLFGLLCTAVLYSLAPPPPAFGLIYEDAILVSQDRRHVFVTPCAAGVLSAVGGESLHDQDGRRS